MKATKDLIRRLTEEGDLQTKSELLKGIIKKQWSAICYDHIRVIAGQFKLQNSIKREELIKRLTSLQGKKCEEIWETVEMRK